MKKIIYTILSVCSIVYIAFLIVNVLREQGMVINLGSFENWFKLIVNFGGVAIIFCFALVNFTGNPLKLVFFILLIVTIVCYVIVLAAPGWIQSWFTK